MRLGRVSEVPSAEARAVNRPRFRIMMLVVDFGGWAGLRDYELWHRRYDDPTSDLW
jgi:hypothetical protein